MDFKNEFFPLLNQVLFKIESDIPLHKVSKSDMFMFNRYASFYNEQLVPVLNQINKLMRPSLEVEDQYYYQVMDAMIPKLKKTYINYVSKPATKKVSKAETFVKDYAKRHDISEQKVWEMLFLVNEIEN